MASETISRSLGLVEIDRPSRLNIDTAAACDATLDGCLVLLASCRSGDQPEGLIAGRFSTQASANAVLPANLASLEAELVLALENVRRKVRWARSINL